MINMPTTDILTPITGEVEKPTTHDHGETADVSFQSIIAAENADTAALITVSDQPLVTHTLRNPQTDHVRLAAAFPAFITASNTGSDSVLPPQGDHLSPPNQPKSSSTPPILLAAVTNGDSGDAQPALIGDARQIIPAAPPYSKETRGYEPGATPRPTVDVPDQTMITNVVTDVPVIGKEEAVNILRPAAAELPLLGSNLTGQPPNAMPFPVRYNSAGPTVETNANSAAPAKQDAPIATPTNAVLPDTAFPKMPADSSEGLLPLGDAPKMSAASQEKPGLIQHTPNAPQAQSKPIEPMNVWSQPPATEPVGDRPVASNSMPAPVQGSAPRSIQAPTVDLPVKHADSGTPVRDQQAGLKTDVTQPDFARPSTITQPQTPPEATTRPEMPLKDIQPPAQGLQNQTKQPPQQRNEAAPMQPVQPIAAELRSAEVTPQTTLPPIAERHTAKLNSQATPVLQTRVSSKSNSAQTAPPSDVVPTVPMTETTTAETLETLSTPELMPFDAKSTDITSVLRHDANINRPEVMRHVAQQLVDAARQMPDRPVELALNPEELGRVRLTFTTTDGGIHIAVMAERGETMDLLRRHIETLAQEFREMGYKDVNFEFSQNGKNDAKNGDADAQSGADPDAAPAQSQTLAPVQLSLEPSAGLDLRL